MEKASLVVLCLFFLKLAEAQNSSEYRAGTFNVGVILDMQTLVGKMACTSISMALEDFYVIHRNCRTKLALHFKDSRRDDIVAASAAADLLENYNIQAIIGPQKSSQATFVSDLGNKSQVPVISFTATSPTVSSAHAPYFLRATLSDNIQVNSIAAIIKMYGWREVVPIYEDTEYGRGIMPYLADTLQEFGASIPYRSAVLRSATTEQIKQELYKLMTMQTRVYIVHMSCSMGSTLFSVAKDVGMMSEPYAWIVTDGIANNVGSLHPSFFKAINGVLGVKLYVPMSKKLDDFAARWTERFKRDNPTDLPSEPSIFDLQGYDTIWAVAQAAEKVGITDYKFEKDQHRKNSTCLGTLGTSTIGPEILDAILHTKFRGISDDFDIGNRERLFSTFQIINMVGTGWKEIGFWTEQHGILRHLNETRSPTTYLNSIPHLSPVTWPGESNVVPKGWQIPANGKKLRIGVLTSGYPEFIKVEKDPITNATMAIGYAIDVFEEALKKLPYAISYEYVAFQNTQGENSGSYNDFVYQVFLKKFDAAVADTTIRYSRTSYVDFTLPYTESGVAMIVPVRDKRNKNTWIIFKPLTPDLWFGSLAFFIYTGIVIWLLERRINNNELGGPFFCQLGRVIYLPFFADRERVDSVLSRMVLIVWVFVLLVLTSSYTASLSSMLTVQQLQPTVTDVHGLVKTGEHVGIYNGSFVRDLLVEIGFDRRKIRAYNSIDGFADALSKGSESGGIAAAIDEVPNIKLFLAKYCRGYTMVGPIYKTQGFGFVSMLFGSAFPKRSPLVYDISRAILSITEGDDIIRIEKKWTGDKNACQNDGTEISSSNLNFSSFSGLFLVFGVASTCALLIAFLMHLYKNQQRIRNSMGNNQIQRDAEEHTDRGDRDTTEEPDLNMQSRIANDSDDRSYPQESEISMEVSNPGSESQTSPDSESRSPINSY